MLVQLPLISFAVFLSGSAIWRAPLCVNTSGVSPSSASPMTTLSAVSGISSAKRLTFCQSMASSTSNASSSVSIGLRPRRTSAAASPPRICGPLVRTMRPYQPAFAAAPTSSVPAVITPLPPLPARAIEMLCAAAAMRGRGGAVVAARAGFSVRGSTCDSRCIRMPTVNRLRGRGQLIEINAPASAAAHDDFQQNRYYGTVIP